MKKDKSKIKYFTSMFEGADGNLSLKRLMQLTGWIVLLILCCKFAPLNIEFVVGTLSGAVLGLTGITAYATVKESEITHQQGKE